MRLAQSQSHGSLITREKRVVPLLPELKEYLSPRYSQYNSSSRIRPSWSGREDEAFMPFCNERDRLGRLIVRDRYYRDVSAVDASNVFDTNNNSRMKFSQVAIQHLDEFYKKKVSKNAPSPSDRILEAITDRTTRGRLSVKESAILQAIDGTDSSQTDQFLIQKQEFFNDIAKLYTQPKRKLHVHKKKEMEIPGIGQYDVMKSDALKFKKSPAALIRKEAIVKLEKPKDNLQKMAMKLVSQHQISQNAQAAQLAELTSIDFQQASCRWLQSIAIFLEYAKESKHTDQQAMRVSDLEDVLLDRMSAELYQLPREFKRKMDWAQSKVQKIQGDLKNWGNLSRGIDAKNNAGAAEANQFGDDDDDEIFEEEEEKRKLKRLSLKVSM